MRWLLITLVLGSFQGFPQKITAEKLIARAEALMTKGQFTESLAPLNECIEKFPATVGAYQLRAQIREHLYKLPEALTDLSIAVELTPESSELLLSRAILAYKLKRFDLARQDFRKLLNFRGTETNLVYFRQSNNEGVDNIITAQSNIRDQVYNYLGLIEYAQENLVSSALYFDSAITSNKLKPDYFAHRGLVRLKQNDLNAAQNDFYQALSLEPDHAVSKNNLAALKRKEGNIAEAAKLLHEAKLANAKAHQHHSGIALLQLESDQYAEAILNFDTAILIEPNDGELFISRGLAKEKLNDLKGAMRDYSRALQLDEQWPKAWFMQGNIFLKQNQFTEALENYTMAISLDENYSLAYHNRAITHMKLGNKKNACTDIHFAEKGMSIEAKMITRMCGN